MEKKTIGGFIAALRKVNGLTQKNLANRLNVSDKTVSRWERDEGTPDLSVIPVIAEIFGITCDELLRGERKSPAERSKEEGNNEPTVKGAKQRQRLLKSALSHYYAQTYIVMGISVIGFIVALIFFLVRSEFTLAFLIGAIFFAASIVLQAVFIKRAFLSVEDSELDENELLGFRRKVVILAEKSIGIILLFVGFTFPMMLAMIVRVGMSTNSILIFGILSSALFLLVYAVICHFLNAASLRKGA